MYRLQCLFFTVNIKSVRPSRSDKLFTSSIVVAGESKPNLQSAAEYRKAVVLTAPAQMSLLINAGGK